MKIPQGMTEEEVVAIITRIAKRLAPRFTFGFFDASDIEQEAFFIACDGLEFYDDSRPLENFLSVHLRNRLTNFVRDNYHRKEKPCDVCGGNYEDMRYCEQCERRTTRINSKRNIMDPIDISNVRDEHERNMRVSCDYLAQLEVAEISFLIDQHLPTEFRSDYLRMLEGIYIPKPRRLKIEEIILEIIENHG